MKLPLRPLRYIADICLAILLVGILGLGLLVWRLDQKPISLNTALPEIQSFLSGQFPGLTFSIGKGMMRSLPEYNAIGLRLDDVTVFNESGKPVGNLQQVKLGFTWTSLLSFSLMPGAIEINRPTINVTRFENGYVGFSFQEKQEVPPEEQQESSLSLEGIAQFFETAPRALRVIRVRDAWFQYDNREYDYKILAEEGLLDFRRRRGGSLSGTLSVRVKSDDFDQKIQGRISDDPETQSTKLVIALKEFDAHRLPLLRTLLPDDVDIEMPVSILFSGMIDRRFHPVGAKVQVVGKKGTVAYAPFYPEPLSLQDIIMTAQYRAAEDKLDVSHMSFRLDDSTVDISVQIQNVLAAIKKADDGKENPDMQISLKGLVRNVPVDRLQTYWPQTLAHNARDWVTTNIRDGMAQAATLEMQGRMDDQHHFMLDDLGGTIGFDGVTVDYLSPMPPVTNVEGTAEYDAAHFNIYGKAGTLFDTKIVNSVVKISDLDKEDALMHIDLETTGPIRDAIETLSSKPLEYAQAMGMRPQQFDGASDTFLHLSFPLLMDLQLEDVAMKTKAILRDVVARDVIKDLDVTGTDLALEVDTSHLHLVGKGAVAGGAADLEWTEYFSKDASVTTDIKVKGAITPKALKDLRVLIDHYFTGEAQADVALVQNSDKSVHVTVTADMTPMAVDVPELGVHKRAGVAATAGLSVVNTADNITTLSDMHASWSGVSVKDASLRFNAQDELESAVLKDVRAGRTNADIIVSPDKNNARRIVVSGDTLDISGIWTKEKGAAEDTKKNTNNHENISVRVKRLFLDTDVAFNNVKADLALRSNDLVKGQVSAETDENGSLFMQKLDKKEGGQDFVIKITNTGRVLQALDATDSLRNGILVLQAQSTAEDKTLHGNVSLKDFTLIKAPIMARLLNAFSPVGLLRLLNDQGLTFQNLNSRIIMSDMRHMRLSKGRMSGDSLGLSFSGDVDLETSKLNIKGTVVPVEGLNKMVGRIPIIGQILTGLKGDGLIGATYGIKGTTSDPDVSVNPLSVLTPGILRSIFFESGQD